MVELCIDSAKFALTQKSLQVMPYFRVGLQLTNDHTITTQFNYWNSSLSYVKNTRAKIF